VLFVLEKGNHVDRRSAEQWGQIGIGLYAPPLSCAPARRDWLSEGGLGRPVLYYATDVREIRPKREMHDSHASGGPIIDMGVHLFHGWAHLFNSKPVEVFAQGLKLAEGRPELAHIQEIAYDTVAITVCYASGDIGTFVVCWGLPPGITLASSPDQISGPNGMVQVEYGLVHQEVQVMREGGGWKVISACEEDMYQLEIAHFGRCVLEDEPPLTTGEDGRTALRVALAALESLETGQLVLLR
jgi:predicted dehydrogenase